MQVRFKGGSPHFVQVTFDSASSAGEVICNQDLILISHVDVPAGEPGNYAIGGGIYEASCNEAILFGMALQWDDTLDLAKKDTAGTHTNNLGFAVEDNDGTTIQFYHQNGFLH